MPTTLQRTTPPPDLAAEVAVLGDADLPRLRAIARLRVQGLPGLDERDLFNEAVLRLLDASDDEILASHPPAAARVAADKLRRRLHRDATASAAAIRPAPDLLRDGVLDSARRPQEEP